MCGTGLDGMPRDDDEDGEEEKEEEQEQEEKEKNGEKEEQHWGERRVQSMHLNLVIPIYSYQNGKI